MRSALDMSLGSGLAKLSDKVFRTGYLGDFNDLMLMGTLSGVEMGLDLACVPHAAGGGRAAMDLTATAGNGARVETSARCDNRHWPHPPAP